jgi:hypothetical protein
LFWPSGVIAAWKKPLKETLNPLLHAHKVAVLTGDNEFAALNANLYCFNKAWSGSSLVEVHKELSKYRSWMQSQKQEPGLKFSESFFHMVHILMGKTEDPTSVTVFDGQIKHAKEKNNVVVESGACKYKVIVSYLFNNCEIRDAVIQPCKQSATADSFVAILQTFQALFCLRNARAGYKKRKSLRMARTLMGTLKQYSVKSPHNFSDKVLLVEAELFSVLGKCDEAYEKFTCAIAMASNSGFTWSHALALERVAWHLLRQPNPDVALAESFFDQACVKYDEWGAFAKAEALRLEVSSIFGPMKANA